MAALKPDNSYMALAMAKLPVFTAAPSPVMQAPVVNTSSAAERDAKEKQRLEAKNARLAMRATKKARPADKAARKADKEAEKAARKASKEAEKKEKDATKLKRKEQRQEKQRLRRGLQKGNLDGLFDFVASGFNVVKDLAPKALEASIKKKIAVTQAKAAAAGTPVIRQADGVSVSTLQPAYAMPAPAVDWKMPAAIAGGLVGGGLLLSSMRGRR